MCGTYVLFVAHANSYMYACDLDLTVTCTAQQLESSEKVTKRQVNESTGSKKTNMKSESRSRRSDFMIV